MNLLMATDGRPFVANGIRVVLNGLELRGLQPQLCVVCPVGMTDRIRETLPSAVGPNRLTFWEAPTDQADPYRLQIALCDAARTFGSERVLALDYDHIVLDDISGEPDTWRGEAVLASSETVDLQAEGMWPKEAAVALGPAPPHINTSLLCSSGNLLHQLRVPWSSAYDEITPHVGTRYRVELALSLAAQRLGLPIRRVSRDFQASFSAPHREPKLFHYGGTSVRAKRMKVVLSTPSPGHNEEPLSARTLRLELERLYRE